MRHRPVVLFWLLLASACARPAAQQPYDVLITGGSGIFVGSAFYSATLEACTRLERRGILVARHRTYVPQILPEEVVWFPELPFALVLARMGAIVHHGGIGTAVPLSCPTADTTVLCSIWPQWSLTRRVNRPGPEGMTTVSPPTGPVAP